MCILKTSQRGKRDVRKKYGGLRERKEREKEREREREREIEGERERKYFFCIFRKHEKYSFSCKETLLKC